MCTLSAVCGNRQLTKMTWKWQQICVGFGVVALYFIVTLGMSSFSTVRPQNRIATAKKSESTGNAEPSEIELLRAQVNSLEASVIELHQAKRVADEMLQNMQKKFDVAAEGGGHSLAPLRTYPAIQFKNYNERKRILITGGAGFVGSHLVDLLMLQGHEVTVADNFFTGRKKNVEHWIGHENFELIHHDVVNPLYIEVDQIYHLASPASPPHYMYNPVKTIKTNTVGTINMLGLAKRVKARLLMASTSEVYGDPEEHPQKEEYWGHVNPIGPRACYDEGKRVAETMCYAYAKQGSVDVRVARIFNTFGPRMHMNDGRVVSNFILQALLNEPITIYGDGTQTRSFQYVSDLVYGLVALMNSNYTLPVNLGNPEEHTVLDFATIIKNQSSSSSDIVHKAAMEDDPRKRKPDISRAKKYIGWEPQVKMLDGISTTIDYFRSELGKSSTFMPIIFIKSS